MILQVSLDNQLPPWAVPAGKALIILMVAGLALIILRDIADMRARWAACAAGNCARGSNVPTPPRIPPMPKKVRIRLIRHSGVDLEETRLKGREKDDRSAGDRLEDDDPGRKHNRH